MTKLCRACSTVGCWPAGISITSTGATPCQLRHQLRLDRRLPPGERWPRSEPHRHQSEGHDASWAIASTGYTAWRPTFQPAVIFHPPTDQSLPPQQPSLPANSAALGAPLQAFDLGALDFSSPYLVTYIAEVLTTEVSWMMGRASPVGSIARLVLRAQEPCRTGVDPCHPSLPVGGAHALTAGAPQSLVPRDGRRQASAGWWQAALSPWLSWLAACAYRRAGLGSLGVGLVEDAWMVCPPARWMGTALYDLCSLPVDCWKGAACAARHAGPRHPRLRLERSGDGLGWAEVEAAGHRIVGCMTSLFSHQSAAECILYCGAGVNEGDDASVLFKLCQARHQKERWGRGRCRPGSSSLGSGVRVGSDRGMDRRQLACLG